jgi:hypothetical protein
MEIDIEMMKKKDRVKTFALLVCVVGIIILSLTSLYFMVLYQQSIKVGAKNTMTALEMVVACADVGNVTMDQIQQRTIEIFVLNKTRSNNG